MGTNDLNSLALVETLETIDRLSDTLGMTLPSADDNLQFIIIIPAKNESSNISFTLKAITQQLSKPNQLFEKSRFEILVLCHNCSDNTYDVCLDFIAAYPDTKIHTLILNSEIVNTVGGARRILMNIASKRIKLPQGFIISTDADTIAESYWLNSFETYLNTDISLVCGLINVNLENLNSQAKSYLTAKDEYLLLVAKLEHQLLPIPHDPWPRHNYHWGPNMGIKQSVYNSIGGIRPLHFLEDVDMYHNVLRFGYKVRHCMNTIVTTSNRIDSRCAEGFGAELKVWSDIDDVPYNVEGLHKLLIRYSIFTLINKIDFSNEEEIAAEICRITFIDQSDFKILQSQTNGNVDLMISMEQYLKNSSAWNEKYPNISVFDACSELRLYLDN